MREEVERHPDRSVPVGIAIGRLHQRAYIADHCNLALTPEFVQAGQARMKSELGANPRDWAGSQQTRLRYRQAAGLPGGRIGAVIVIRNDHITTVVAAVQEDAN